MRRILRGGLLFLVLFAGVVRPAAADPVLMFLIGIARDMITNHAAARNLPRPADPMPDFGKVYPGTSVEPEHLRRLIDDSFLYLAPAQRAEIFEALHAHLLEPRNAAVRGTMIQFFAERALAVRAAQFQLQKMPWSDKQRMAEEFRQEIASLNEEDRDQLRGLLRQGLLPVPADLNGLLLAAFESRFPETRDAPPLPVLDDPTASPRDTPGEPKPVAQAPRPQPLLTP